MGASMVAMTVSYVRQQYEAHGMRRERVEVDDGETVIRCWIPWRQPERGVWSAGVADKPALLLLHDFVADATINWEKQVGAFSGEFNVYVPDLLFFGGSATKSAERTEAFQAECMVKMLHALEVYNEVSARIALSRKSGLVMMNSDFEFTACTEIVQKLVGSAWRILLSEGTEALDVSVVLRMMLKELIAGDSGRSWLWRSGRVLDGASVPEARREGHLRRGRNAHDAYFAEATAGRVRLRPHFGAAVADLGERVAALCLSGYAQASSLASQVRLQRRVECEHCVLKLFLGRRCWICEQIAEIQEIGGISDGSLCWFV